MSRSPLQAVGSAWQSLVTPVRRWYAGLPRLGQLAVKTLSFIAVAAFFYTLPLWEPPLFFTPDSDWATVLFNVGLFVLLALGLNIVVGMAGLLDLGYVGFYAVGAYSVAVFSSPESELATAYPWLVCVPIAIFLAMASGVILGTPTLRLRGDYLAIVTLGFGEIVRLTAVNSEFLGGSQGIKQIPHPPGTKPDGRPLFGVLDASYYYYLVLTLIIIVLLLVRNLELSRVGRAWVAIREDEDAAELMGVPTFKFKLWAFTMGAAIGGLAGATFASKPGFINPQSFPVLVSILILAAVVLGGAGNRIGVIVGAVIVAYLPERFREFTDYRFLIFGSVLVLVMIFRPQGLIPNRRRAHEIEDRLKEAEVVNV